MKLEIVSSQQIFVYDVVWLEVETVNGNRIIQPEHAPMILLLSKNKKTIFCLKDGEEKSITIKGGIVHVTRSHVVILITGNNEKSDRSTNRRISC